MKTEIQIIKFLEFSQFKSHADWELIQIFCERHKVHISALTPKKFFKSGIDSQQFINWYNSGFGSGDVAIYNGNLCILSKCGCDEAKISGTIINGLLDETKKIVKCCDLIPVTPKQTKQFLTTISKLGRQYHHSSLTLAQKYIPRINERVEFWGEENKHGLGVIRDIDIETGEIELYCYYFYNNGQIGYSMHEPGVVSLHEFLFENMAISQQRRLNRELERVGKVWNEKMHRIEPVNAKLPKGEKYWYISDKIKIVQDIEKGTPTSHFRYLAGNYFKDYDDALDYLSQIHELLRDRLARPEK